MRMTERSVEVDSVIHLQPSVEMRELSGRFRKSRKALKWRNPKRRATAERQSRLAARSFRKRCSVPTASLAVSDSKHSENRRNHCDGKQLAGTAQHERSPSKRFSGPGCGESGWQSYTVQPIVFALI